MKLLKIESKEEINRNEKEYGKKIEWYGNCYISL